MKISQYQAKSTKFSKQKAEYKEINFPDDSPHQKKKTNFSFALMLGICLIFFLVSSMVYVIYEESGKPDITPERKEQLARDLEKIDNAEQYALRATKSKHYLCLSCQNPLDSIFLKIGEIYKYGVTMNGEKGRYKNALWSRDLFYERQFDGTYSECLKQEKIKIYYYPTLPENLARVTKLLRPAGNPQDR